MLFSILLTLIVILTICVYYLNKKNKEYWSKRNVPFHEVNKVFGPFWDFVFGNQALFEIIGDIHKKYPDSPCVATGSFIQPILLVVEPKNIHHITQVDFESFYHRGVEMEEGGGLGDTVPFMNGKRWKVTRKNMTPLFTVAKLRNMYTVMDKSAHDFVRYLNDHPEKLKGDFFNTLSTFCSAAIAASVFGITTESIFDSPFLEMAQKALLPTFANNVRLVITIVLPWMARLFRLKLFTEHEKFFTNAVRQIIKKRKENGGQNTDFAELCVNLQNKGEIKDNETGFAIKPTDEFLAAQAFFFFIAGVEPSATTLFCVLFELGRNPDILERVHNEIDEIFDKNQNKISYDILNEFKYVPMVIEEGLRMYPPIGVLTRQCVKDTVLPVGNVKVGSGTKVFMNLYQVQRNPDLFSEPDKFIPERFLKDSELVIDPLLMSFGRGNRICIGERFAKIQVTTGLVYLLRNFTVKSYMQGDEMKFSKEQFQVRPSNIDFEFIPRKIKS